ncbi:hypothetical protein LY76DRAFT_676045 [Colletotrichum caudatum]|nr:hypothetical protein LY76DRAFT_676045 [Colletotrichum caudatum]
MHRASEVVWNTEVHHQILRCALRGDEANIASGLVNFTICTSAPINRHIVNCSPSKMVDFCFYIDPDVAGLSDPAVKDAIADIGTWHAAQWKFLARMRASKGLTLDGLEFLPGLIVQGNDWFFVASTRKGDETTLWTKQTIGTTRSALRCILALVQSIPSPILNGLRSRLVNDHARSGDFALLWLKCWGRVHR